MKILHICETAKGGIATYLSELLPLLHQDDGALSCRLIMPQSHVGEMTESVQAQIVPFHRTGRSAGLFYLCRTIMKELSTNRPDIVHAHSTFAGIIARVLCLFYRVPVVYCPHGWATDMGGGAARSMLYGFIERVMAHFCKKIIAISEWERRRGIDIGIAGDKIVTIYNGIAAKPPPFEPAVWQDDRLKLLFIGRFDRQKGVDVLLEAVSGLKDQISLRLIGGAVNDKDTLDLSAHENVASLSWLPRQEIFANIAACDAVVVPSRWEGFGLVAIEAMRLSKPVIASQVGGLQELVIHEETGYLCPAEDPAALENLLKTLDKAALQDMGRASYDAFMQRFTAERMAKKIKSLYEELVK